MQLSYPFKDALQAKSLPETSAIKRVIPPNWCARNKVRSLFLPVPLHKRRAIRHCLYKVGSLLQFVRSFEIDEHHTETRRALCNFAVPSLLDSRQEAHAQCIVRHVHRSDTIFRRCISWFVRTQGHCLQSTLLASRYVRSAPIFRPTA